MYGLQLRFSYDLAMGFIRAVMQFDRLHFFFLLVAFPTQMQLNIGMILCLLWPGLRFRVLFCV